MKTINHVEKVAIPEGVEVQIKSRNVMVKGPRGILKRSFKHVAVDIYREKGGKEVKVECWFGDRKKNACVRTIASHIKNMVTGVTKGYRYKMRFVYAHFPVNTKISDDKKSIEIRNFLGEKVVRRVDMLEGCTISATGNKDEIQIEGNDIEKVSQSAANIHMATLVKNKDIRKFLDGIYVSEKSNVVQD